MAELARDTPCGSAARVGHRRAEGRFRDDIRVEWLGRITDDGEGPPDAGRDVFCAPSLRGESFGVVLLEAMAAGTPVVASDLPGYRNVAIADRERAFGARRQPGKARFGAPSVLTDRALSARLSAAGDARAREFSMDSLAEAYLGIYDDPIEAHGCAPAESGDRGLGAPRPYDHRACGS